LRGRGRAGGIFLPFVSPPPFPPTPPAPSATPLVVPPSSPSNADAVVLVAASLDRYKRAHSDIKSGAAAQRSFSACLLIHFARMGKGGREGEQAKVRMGGSDRAWEEKGGIALESLSQSDYSSPSAELLYAVEELAATPFLAKSPLPTLVEWAAAFRLQMSSERVNVTTSEGFPFLLMRRTVWELILMRGRPSPLLWAPLCRAGAPRDARRATASAPPPADDEKRRA